MGFRYRLASTLHDAYSDLGPSHLLIIRILAARRFDFNNVHFFASASATASKSTRTLLRTLPLDHLPASLNHTQFSPPTIPIRSSLLVLKETRQQPASGVSLDAALACHLKKRRQASLKTCKHIVH